MILYKNGNQIYIEHGPNKFWTHQANVNFNDVGSNNIEVVVHSYNKSIKDTVLISSVTDKDGVAYGSSVADIVKVISSDSGGLAISSGNVQGQTNVNKFGNAPDFDTGDGEVDIWDGANDSGANQMTYQFSTTADIDSISSSSASDTVDIEVQGLDSNYDLVNQTITLSGQTRVALTTDLIRVFRMKNVGNTDLVGNLYCYVNTAITSGVPDDSTKIRAVISIGNNQTEMALYTVPSGKTAYIRELYASTAGGSRTSNYIIKLKIRPFGQVFQLKHRRAIIDAKDLVKKFDMPEKATEKSDIIVTAETTESSITGSSVSAGFDIVLVDN
jgi:hypothetical protein